MAAGMTPEAKVLGPIKEKNADTDRREGGSVSGTGRPTKDADWGITSFVATVHR